MAAPNSYNFTVTRDQLIEHSLRHISVIGEGETASAAQVSEAAILLNMMLKLRAAEGMPLMSVRRGTILPFTGASSINTNSHVVTAYDWTTLTAAAAASATVLAVTSSSGMSNSDEVGIELTSGAMHWDTITSVDSSTQITLTTGLAAAASSGGLVYAYTAASDRVQRPLRIMDANLLTTTTGSGYELTLEERRDYWNLSQRDTASTPNRIFYDPILGTRAADPTSSTTWYGTIYVYPRFSDGKDVIEFTYQEPMQDLDAASDNPYWPQEFYLPLMLELAALQGPKYGLELDERKALFAEAKAYREEALETIWTEGSLYLSPERENG